MPEMKDYTITQTRQVKVWANDLEGAVVIADAEFAREHHERARKLNKANATAGRVTWHAEETHVTVERSGA